ncbi:hypothetical protein GCM10007989_13530 [Devosia pacifica]|uniref:Uncharacterized protein n=1 Tax=Devosia pacifica TaxID=1335967 RepID=A0A918S0K8_9HYPH|nr:hypothetical protein [Devosia pacifica]GHA19310.1 hypothetical protein GCM10007989_13530 [Devosia pacifica]
MKLLKNWRKIVHKAWSIRLLILAGILSGAEVALPFLHGVLPIRPGVFAALSGVTCAAAFVARLIAQSSIGDEE